MSALDDFKLYFEKLPHERRELLVNSYKRASIMRAERLLKRAEAAAEKVLSIQLFKRLRRVEDKLDKPFIHESGLSQYIEDVVDQKLAEKRPRKAKK